jgi:glutaredoxin domain-containing cysteine-rich protein 1
MGCVSSKLFKKELHQQIIFNNGGQCVDHVVSLTSSTYGALKLDCNNQHQQQPPLQQEQKQEPIKEIVEESKRLQQISPTKEDPEVVNTWELMGDLEEGVPVSSQAKRSPNSRVLLRGFADLDLRSPLKFLNQIGSPRKAKTYGGKENKVKRSSDFSPRPVLKANNSSGNSCKAVLRLSYPVKASPVGAKTENLRRESGFSPRRKSSFIPLFDPELVALYEKDLSEEEEEEIERIILPSSRTTKVKNLRDLESILQSFEQKCPPGGENKVVIYTTTLRGIRKTFEDCNTVRSIIESHHIHIVERDVSMDSGFKEELRGLMGTNEVKVPLVFVKGRLIGGADQVVKLEEEGKFEILFDGIPKGLAGGCEGCAGVRFVMCVECNGSCKVLNEKQKKMVRCGECNENGLMQCPICC